MYGGGGGGNLGLQINYRSVMEQETTISEIYMGILFKSSAQNAHVSNLTPNVPGPNYSGQYQVPDALTPCVHVLR